MKAVQDPRDSACIVAIGKLGSQRDELVVHL